MKIKAGIAGAAGYTGGELIRILLNHPDAEIAFAYSKSNAGNFLYDIHTDLIGETILKFSDTVHPDIDVLFLCVGHGEAQKFLASNTIAPKVKVIDLSQDFRLNRGDLWIYGSPELNRENIRSGKFHIANPGCFATAIQLALLPLAKAQLLKNDIHVSGTTGSTGAGQSLSLTSHFSWRNNNLSAYKSFEHQHLAEIMQSIGQLQNGSVPEIHFIPHRGSFTRGIHVALYVKTAQSLDDMISLYEQYYETHPFVHIARKAVDLKQVVNTNKCLLHLEKHGEQLLITSVIDNLLKGASGQAVQNMNLLFGLKEENGLKLKAAAF